MVSPRTVPIFSLEDLASDARDAISDLLDDDEWEKLEAASRVNQIIVRFTRADCDDFALALHMLTGWDFLAVSNSHGPMHRLCITPDGHMVDVTGYVTAQQMRERYGQRALITRVQGVDYTLDDDEALRRVVGVIEHLVASPFPVLHEAARTFAQTGQFFGEAGDIQRGTSTPHECRPAGSGS